MNDNIQMTTEELALAQLHATLELAAQQAYANMLAEGRAVKEGILPEHLHKKPWQTAMPGIHYGYLEDAAWHVANMLAAAVDVRKGVISHAALAAHGGKDMDEYLEAISTARISRV